MANPLTGGFDALIQIAASQINGMLATLHQHGASAEAKLKLLHGVRVRIGETRRRPADAEAFGDWVLEYQDARPAGPRRPVRDLLVGTLPPGASKRVEAAFDGLDAVADPSPPDLVRGTATVQLSTIRVSVADGSTSEVTIHADIRAQYAPDPGTTPLPAAITGEVRAVYEVRTIPAGTKTRLLIRPSAQDQKIAFIPGPGSGITAADAARIATHVRRMLREGITLIPVDLPEGFPFREFRGLGGGGSNVIALPLQLSANPPPAGGVQAVTHQFIGPAGFGFAISREFVEGLIDPVKIADEIRKRSFRIGVSVWGYSATVTYRLAFTSGPALTFTAGAIEIAGRVAVTTDTWWAPNGFVAFTQRIALVLDAATQRVDVVTDGEPSVDESWFIPHGTAVDAVKSGVAEALAANRTAVRQVFEDSRAKLGNALREFEPSASATYTQLEVSPDGVVVRGQVAGAHRFAPVVEFGEVRPGQPFTAFESWIPGGRIDRFIWSWVEYPPLRPDVWSGVAKTVAETDSFLLERPGGINEVSRICLRVEGERILPDGRIESVAAGTTCAVGEPVIGIESPSWWEPVTVPLWKPDLPDAATLRDGIAAHVSLQTDRPRRELMQNTLVCFPDWLSSTPFDALVRGLLATRQPVAPVVFIILPSEAFDLPRREVRGRLAAFPAAIAARLQVAEDSGGGWSRTFGVNAAPSLFLINARGEFVWNSAEEPDPDALAAALDSLIVPAPRPRFQPLRLKVVAGDRAPDALFRDDRGEEGALHRLLGRSVLVSFWQSWSAPCLAELRRLEALQHGDARSAPVVIAFHGGPAPKSFEEIRRQHGLSFALVQDTEHRIARAFGVRCWPTTIGIDPDGRIEHIQLGVAPHGERDAAD
jgi:peroxiredoxin